MQCYTILFITVNALHVSGGYSTHHQELKNCTQSIWYMSSLLAATASGSSKQACSLYLKELFPKVDKANSPAPLRVSCWICMFWLNSQYSCFLPEMSLVRFLVRSPLIQTNRFYICKYSSNICANTEVVSVPSHVLPCFLILQPDTARQRALLNETHWQSTAYTVIQT